MFWIQNIFGSLPSHRVGGGVWDVRPFEPAPPVCIPRYPDSPRQTPLVLYPKQTRARVCRRFCFVSKGGCPRCGGAAPEEDTKHFVYGRVVRHILTFVGRFAIKQD